MGEYIFLLGSEDAAASLIGTKAANLNDLARADFRVPPAFVVTTHAFRRLITYNGLKSRIAALEQQGVFAQIRSLFKGAEMPEDLRHEIVSAYRELGAAGKVAVRSSAAAEDLPDASFAGQMDTFLNVSGEGALIESIIACFSSFWTDRAMAYRNNRQLDPTQSGHAVIVQHMVAADISGILFTVNPVSGDACEMIINAAHGSGEVIVSGEVTPDNIVVDSSSGRVKSVESGNRQQALRNDQIGGLVRLGRALEKHFGRPQDLEWAIWKEAIYVIQSRPVTSNRNLVQCPGDDNWPACGKFSPQPFDRWSRANVGEMWPDPVSPLVWSTIPDIVSEAVRFSLRGVRSKSLQQAQWAARFYGRVYYNEGALERVLTHELGLPPSFMDKSRGSSQERGDASNDRTHIGRVLLHAPVLLRLALRQRQTGRALETQLLKVDQWVSGFNLEEQKKKTDRQLLEDALCWVERVKQTLNLQYEMSGISLTAAAALERLMMRWFKRDGLAQELITGLSGIQAAEMGADLWAITRKLKSERLEGIVLTMHASEALKELRRNDKARSISALLDDFIERHGHRCPNEAEWLYPRWADAPEQIIEIIAAYLKSETLDLEAPDAKQRQRRAAAIAWVESRIGILRKAIFASVLGRAEHSVRLRDNGKGSAIKASYPARRIAVLIGQRWTGAGWLQREEDIFFLTVSDLQKVIDSGDPSKAGLDLQSVVRDRRTAFAYWYGYPAPDVIDSNGKLTWGRETESNGSMLKGIATSGGIVRGNVRIVHSPAEATKLQPGDILVTRSTDAGWTVFFPLLKGLVTEIGGQLSHAAILAREYGLPAVVNVKNATRELKDRQIVTIDGSKGIVYVDTGGGFS